MVPFACHKDTIQWRAKWCLCGRRMAPCNHHATTIQMEFWGWIFCILPVVITVKIENTLALWPKKQCSMHSVYDNDHILVQTRFYQV
jgi:hypothetical protein